MGWRDILSRRVVRARAEGSFVVDAEMHRSEELRPEHLGPGMDEPEFQEAEWEPPDDGWRPRRTLGPIKRR